MSQEITYHSHEIEFEWENFNQIEEWLQLAIQNENHQLESLSYIYCSDSFLHEMNKEYLNHDYLTDVITFDLSDGSVIEGEIFISLDRISENSKSNKISFEEELCRVKIHGLLHLLGYDDHSQEDKTTMTSKENHYLSLLPNVPRGTFYNSK